MPSARPNIVLIVADDMGYGDVGYYNLASRIPTPNMDQLAASGRIFTDMHSPSAVCTPSRYGLLTGRYCWRSSLKSRVLYNYEPPLIEPDRPTIASHLKANGYDTALVGKWHLGLTFRSKPGTRFDFSAPLPWDGGSPDPDEEAKIDFSAPITGGPLDVGFDTFFGTSGCSTAQPPYAFIEDDHMVNDRLERHENTIPGGRSGMMAPGWRHEDVDVIHAAKAVEYIRSRRAIGESTKDDSGRATGDRPFFLLLAASAPHEPAIPQTVPDLVRGASDAGPRGDLVHVFDWMVGRVVEALVEVGELDNTLLIVTSDNGALPGHSASIDGYPPWYDFGHASCGSWRGYKSHIWEGGHREPFIVHWPGMVPSGSRCGVPASFTDLLPSIAALVKSAGDAQPLPPEAAEDGIDLSRAIVGADEIAGPGAGDGAGRGSRPLVHHSVFGHFAIRSDEWKLILGTRGSGGWPPPSDGAPDWDGPGQLYDLVADPGEEHDRHFDRPDVVERLRRALEHERRQQP